MKSSDNVYFNLRPEVLWSAIIPSDTIVYELDIKGFKDYTESDPENKGFKTYHLYQNVRISTYSIHAVQLHIPAKSWKIALQEYLANSDTMPDFRAYDNMRVRLRRVSRKTIKIESVVLY